MRETAAGIPEFHIQPGETCIVQGDAILRTVLGSCVGITFWNRRLELAALCHPMLPRYPARAEAVIPAAAERYVDSSIREIAARLKALGADPGQTEVKLFGGADVLEIPRTDVRPTVGRLNAEAAARILRLENFYTVASSLGGNCGLQIQFDSRTGEVLLRRLSCGILRRRGPDGRE